MLDARAADPLFGSLAVRTPEGHLSLVYKAAAEIGELGDNTRALREAIVADPLLQQALALATTVEAVVLGHTRWASVGIISQANAHPLNSEELDSVDGPYVTAVLNGDVDNFADLKASEALRIADEITTDAKVIPTLTSRAMRRRHRAWWRRSAARSTSSRARSPSPPAPPARPTICSSPCGAAARRSTSVWPTTASSWPASPTAWSRRPTRTSASTATSPPIRPTRPAAAR